MNIDIETIETIEVTELIKIILFGTEDFKEEWLKNHLEKTSVPSDEEVIVRKLYKENKNKSFYNT